jgi:hypothetical protein
MMKGRLVGCIHQHAATLAASRNRGGEFDARGRVR